MKTWVDNELIDDGDMNYISRRLVNEYADEADRSAGIPSPYNGQLAYVGGLGLTMYSGGAWRFMQPIPGGGSTGQVLAKLSGASNDIGWVDPA